MKHFKYSISQCVFHISILLVILFLLFSPNVFWGRDQTNRLATAYPSHISLAVDDKTFAGLQASNFLLNEFAGTKVKSMTVDGGESWTGVYIYGRNSYLEIYPEEEGFPAGSCSIALEVSRKGDLKKIREKLEEIWGTSLGKIELRSKVTDDHETPWFHYLDLYDFVGSDVLAPWLLEWDPEEIKRYFKKPISALVDDQGKRYDDPSFNAERIFENFIEINAALKRSELDAWSRFLSALGFKRSEKGKTVRFIRSDLTFNFSIDSKTDKIELKLSLVREYTGKEEYNFGDTLKLKFKGDKTASLFFIQD